MYKLNFILRVMIILYIINRSSCDIRNITIPYKEQDYNFNVNILQHKAFHDVPIWTIESNLDKTLKYSYEGIIQTNGVLYEDTEMKAILFEKESCDANCWEGVFGFGTKRNVLDSNTELQLNLNNGIYKSYSIDASLREENRHRIKRSKSKTTESNEQTFYPKLLVVVDNALFKKLNSDVGYTIKYLSIFWSAVDLQYRNITLPKLEVRITGLIIAKDDKALQYVSKNSPDGINVNIDEVLYASRNETDFIKSTNITNYNAVVTMTGLIGYSEVGARKVRVGSNGVSWNGTICMDDYHFSVIVDDGSYFGIHNTIHELGHLLGLDHDAVPGNAFDCFPTNRRSLTVMWPRYEERDVEFWSDCSLNALKIFSEDDELSWCCRSDPHQK